MAVCFIDVAVMGNLIHSLIKPRVYFLVKVDVDVHAVNLNELAIVMRHRVVNLRGFLR